MLRVTGIEKICRDLARPLKRGAVIVAELMTCRPREEREVVSVGPVLQAGDRWPPLGNMKRGASQQDCARCVVRLPGDTVTMEVRSVPPAELSSGGQSSQVVVSVPSWVCTS